MVDASSSVDRENLPRNKDSDVNRHMGLTPYGIFPASVVFFSHEQTLVFLPPTTKCGAATDVLESD